MPGTGFTSPKISSSPSKVWLVQHTMFARQVKIWVSAGYTATANVKSYSQVAKPIPTIKISELEIKKFRYFFCLDLIY
jgi:hypothetical protein